MQPTHDLGEAIATLAARLHAATYALLVLLREFDERGGWGGGFTSCAHWLSWRTGIDPGAAREKVRVARALATLPLLSAALAEGRLSYAKVRALTRVARPETEQSLLSVALATTAAQVERLVGAWRRVDALKAAREDARRHLARGLSVWVDDDGMVVVRGRLSPEQGAVLQRALDAVIDRLWKESRTAASHGTFEDDVTPTQRRADAIARVAEVALSADLDAGTASDRYQVVLHVEAAAAETSEPPSADPPATRLDGGTLELGDGATYVSAETSARLSCDAAVVRMHHAEDGAVLDVGRKTRTVPSAIRRALEARDRHCRFPGCTACRCDAHHVEHWADGGATRLDNLLLLCRRHHRAVHEGGVRVVQEGDQGLAFYDRHGRRLDVAPAASAWAGDALGDVPADVDGRRLAVWDGTPLNVVYAIDVMYPQPRA